jgi:hypothetical protein
MGKVTQFGSRTALVRSRKYSISSSIPDVRVGYSVILGRCLGYAFLSHVIDARFYVAEGMSLEVITPRTPEHYS